MKTLFIDTHLFDIHIILFNNDKIYKEEKIINEKHNSKHLMPLIKKVCDNEKIDQIIVVNGPGSFTGVRLGVTIAKTMGYCLNIPIKTVNYLDLMYQSNKLAGYYGISDNNGYFLRNFNGQDTKYFYLNNSEYKLFVNESVVITDVTIDFDNIFSFIDSIKPINPHEAKPLYIKLIGVENDKKN